MTEGETHALQSTGSDLSGGTSPQSAPGVAGAEDGVLPCSHQDQSGKVLLSESRAIDLYPPMLIVGFLLGEFQDC